MKTTALFRMMVLAVIVIASAMSAEVKAQDVKFVTNEEVVNNHTRFKNLMTMYPKKVSIVSMKIT